MDWAKGRIVAAALAWGCIVGAAGPAATGHAIAAETAAAEEEEAGGIRFGIDREEYEAQARAAMQVDPVVARHIGAIRHARLDEDASMAEPGPDVLVFDVEGSRGKGRVTARFITVSANEEALGPGTLAMADGTEHAIEGDADALARADARDGHGGHDHGEALDTVPGGDIFTRQAREAAQRYPLVREHIGEITRFDLDALATGEAPGLDEFVFEVDGSKGRGRLLAEFITVDADTERLGKGVLTMADGKAHPFEGEPPSADEAAGDLSSMFASLQDNIFIRQAREAAQRYPLVQEHIGTLSRFDLDLFASGEAEGANEFVFDLAGDKGSGRLLAEFITVDVETERLGKGVLTLAGGREIPFEGEPPRPGEGSEEARGERIPDTFATQDGVFVRQARVAMQAHPVVARHIGDIREARFDREASWALAGDRYAFDLTGSKGRGRLVAEFITVDADSERIGEGELVTADGKAHALKAP